MQEKTSCLILVVFVSSTCILCSLLRQASSLLRLISGSHMAGTLLPCHCSACLRSNREQLQFEDVLEVSFPRFHLRGTSVHAAYRTEYTWLRGGFFGNYTDAIISGLDLDPNDHTSYRLIPYSSCIFTWNILSIQRIPDTIANTGFLITSVSYQVYERVFYVTLRFLIFISTEIRRNSLFHGCSLY